jgi:hypothetical protein
MSLQQIVAVNENLTIKLATEYNLSDITIKIIDQLTFIEKKEKASFLMLVSSLLPDYIQNRKRIKNIGSELKNNNISKINRKSILKIIKEKISISNKIHYLRLMQSLFKYWHVAHLPFALVMLIIMFIHIIVTVSLGYRWIF